MDSNEILGEVNELKNAEHGATGDKIHDDLELAGKTVTAEDDLDLIKVHDICVNGLLDPPGIRRYVNYSLQLQMAVSMNHGQVTMNECHGGQVKEGGWNHCNVLKVRNCRVMSDG